MCGAFLFKPYLSQTMNPNLLPNRELDNYKEQDSFNFLIKAEAIRIFLEQNTVALEKNKMLVLYGDWGSGKTSLMRHIDKSNKVFKENFTKIENALLQEQEKKILVFIDDLDRCEPENVLNLITALKLFFTYGEKTVFFAGMDKEAVNKAVQTKYHNVIKSE